MHLQLKPHPHHPITVTGAVRYAAVTTALAMLILAMAWEMHPLNHAGALPPARVLVQEGDTLWRLAHDYGPAHSDPRRTVSRIREANNLHGSLITPGEVLLIPQS